MREPTAAIGRAAANAGRWHASEGDPRDGGRVRPGDRLDLRLLRQAVHGWWLGNPLVRMPGTADVLADARKLASAGAASGTLALDDERRTDDAAMLTEMAGGQPALVRAVLILRPTMPRAPVVKAAAWAMAEVVRRDVGCACVVRRSRDVVLAEGQHATRVCRVAAREHEDATLVSLWVALGPLWAAGHSSKRSATRLVARPDWREVLLARVLHELEGRLSALRAALPAEALSSSGRP